MRGIVFTGPGAVEYRDNLRMPELERGWALIEVSHVGVCGSDLTIFEGKHPRARAPLVMGHEFSGYLRTTHPQFKKGDLVTVYPYLSCGQCEPCKHGQVHVCKGLRIIGIDLNGGMAEYVKVPHESIEKVPDGISPPLAAFIEPVGISVHAVRQGGYQPGESVAVFGAGAIGLSTAISLRHFGADKLIISEPNPARQALARELGFDVLDSEKDLLSQIYERTDGEGVQFIYDCAGVQPVAEVITEAVTIKGKIVIIAGYRDRPRIDFQKCMFKELSIQFVRNCTRDDFKIAGRLSTKNLGYERLLNCTVPLTSTGKGFPPESRAYKVMFNVGGGTG
ncbi:MAG: alcohol dehydrogenase catalytic domain-containing protein [Firmicutes bacterium]|nr:alcohol dehydrogenase catalytic domain-containing protein [Bacillota bacterium]